MKRTVIGCLVLVLSAVPAISRAAQGQTQLTANQQSIIQNMAQAIERCQVSKDTPGCAGVMQFMASVDQVNAAPQPLAPKTAAPLPPASKKTEVASGGTASKQDGVQSPAYRDCSPASLDDTQKAAKSNVGFQATTDTKNATLSWQVPVAQCAHETDSLKISVQSPVDQSADFENVATLDGLTKSTSIGLEYSFFKTKNMPWNVLTINAKFGTEQHTYYSATDLTKSTVTRTPYQIGISYEYLLGVPQDVHQALNFSYNYQQAFTDGGKVGQTEMLCPVSATGPVKCVSGYINAPTNDKKHLFTVNYTSIYEDNFTGTPLAISPSVTFDAGSHQYGIELPLYLMPNSSKYLTGGIRYDWNSNKHESVIGVFVTSPLCLAPGATVCSKSGTAAGQ